MEFLHEGETNLVFLSEELTTAAVQQGEELVNSDGIRREWKMQIGERESGR